MTDNPLNREIREPVHFSSKKFNFNMRGDQKSKRFFLKNISPSGLGAFSFGSEFLGRGCTITSTHGADYIVRWVKVRFGFLYEFGLERTA
jgi:hypothetical protein